MTEKKCCCSWGAAVGNRGHKGTAEYPEFGCAKCPVHKAALGETELCKHHKFYQPKNEISDRWYPR